MKFHKHQYRRALLEGWAVFLLAGVVGFLGPFGTYNTAEFLPRFVRWWALLVGAYILVRPLMLIFDRIAHIAGLPVRALTFWGMVGASFPLTIIWHKVGADELQNLGGYAGLFPFGLLCSVTVLLVAWWAERIDRTAARQTFSSPPASSEVTLVSPEQANTQGSNVPDTSIVEKLSNVSPRLFSRLPPHFGGPILALESEDHYVRVHSADRSELILVRLRDAIAEMDGVSGEQVHRSWWVAAAAVAKADTTGRALEIDLTNGLRVPVARDSVYRLRSTGFLPARDTP